jgi:EAL and modified HD-GYP domain-containing signal transduction protein
LLALLSNDETTLSDLERVIGADSVLSHKLMRVLSSAAFGFHSPIESLRQAILLLGRQQIRTWATLMAMVGFGSGTDMIMTVLWRAQMCKALADRIDRVRQDTYFTAGLLSTLDRLLGMSMAEVVASLSLADDLRAALLHRAGPVGDVLAAVEAYESCDWGRARCRDLTDDDLRSAWILALRWSREVERFTRG